MKGCLRWDVVVLGKSDAKGKEEKRGSSEIGEGKEESWEGRKV